MLWKIVDFNQISIWFHEKISTCDALIELTNCICNSSKSKKYPASILIHFKKAFDTISNSISINKLEHFGIRGIPLRLFESYLDNRKFFVTIDSVSSSIRDIGIVIFDRACFTV